MKVIVNVDDYGFTKSEVDGVIYAYQNGIVTSTTCMANMPDENLEYAAKKSVENPGLGVGLHLNLTKGDSLTNGKTISNPDGSFKGNMGIDYATCDREEIYQEFKAQIERFKKFFGRTPDHLDGHHRTYPRMDTNGIRDICKRLMDEYDIKGLGREANPNVKYDGCLYHIWSVESFRNIVEEEINSGIDCIEVACHVSFVDEELMNKTSYNVERLEELKVVCSKEMKDLYKELNLEKATY